MLISFPAMAEDLVIWMRTNQPAEDKALKQIISLFEAGNPDTTVKFDTRSVDEHKSALRSASQSKTGPDIYYMWAGLGGEFVKAGLSAPLDEYYKKCGWSDRLRPLADSYTNLYPPSKHRVPSQVKGEAPLQQGAVQEGRHRAAATTYAELVADAELLKTCSWPPSSGLRQ